MTNDKGQLEGRTISGFLKIEPQVMKGPVNGLLRKKGITVAALNKILYRVHQTECFIHFPLILFSLNFYT